jgi:predicted HicB family RNase H-like nuclease
MKNQNRSENIMFRITPELKKRLDWLSSREGISLNEWLNRKIEPITKDEIVRLMIPF